MKRSKAAILLVEDDVWLAQQSIRTLERVGFTVRHVKDGIAAIEAVDAAVPDAIILDMFLPGPNALVLLHELQSYADLSAVPVILCTNSATSVPATALSAYGIEAVIDKAVMQPGDLSAAVKRVLA